jgi:hypothetical protein
LPSIVPATVNVPSLGSRGRDRQLLAARQVGQGARIHALRAGHRQVDHDRVIDPLEDLDHGVLDRAGVGDEGEAAALLGRQAGQERLLDARAQADREQPGVAGVGARHLERGLGVALAVGEEQDDVGAIVGELGRQGLLEGQRDLGAAVGGDLGDVGPGLGADLVGDRPRLFVERVDGVVEHQHVDPILGLEAGQHAIGGGQSVGHRIALHRARVIDHQVMSLGATLALRSSGAVMVRRT